MIAHHSVNFDPIQKSFETIALYSQDSFWKNFKAIASVV